LHTRGRKASPKRPRRRALPQAPLNPALDRAQQLIYDAWDSGDSRREVALAKEALEISPLCADAYVTLGSMPRPARK
jgi:hypothetical protein